MKISFLLTALLIPVTALASFSDVSVHHQNKAAIDYVQSKGIVKGYSDGTFGPNKSINRAEFTKIIIESLYDSSTGGSCFPDVTDQWFAKYVCYAKTLGMIGGYPDGTFQPERPVQFVEAAKIISNGFNLSGEKGDEWFAEFVRGLASRNAIPVNIRSFNQELTRADMAEIIHRLDAKISHLDSGSYESLGGTPVARTQSFSEGKKYPYSFPLSSNWKDERNFYIDNDAPVIEADDGINLVAKLDLDRVERIEEPGGKFPALLRVHYPKGAGSNFIAHFYDKAKAGVVAIGQGKMMPTENIHLRYYVRFPEDFDFGTSGSLPGVKGGITTSNYGVLGSDYFVGAGWTKKGELSIHGGFQDEFDISRITEIDLAADNEWHRIDIIARSNTVPVRRLNGSLIVQYDGEQVFNNNSISFRSRADDVFDALGFFSTIGTLDTFTVAKKDMYLDLAGFIVSDKPL